MALASRSDKQAQAAAIDNLIRLYLTKHGPTTAADIVAEISDSYMRTFQTLIPKILEQGAGYQLIEGKWRALIPKPTRNSASRVGPTKGPARGGQKAKEG